ncbi:MAG: hypothetical protein EB059_07830 [Alphaproteobacteria bacterium]|nr:hypothetical protein [Alphaproteobacteria bacterium]
MADPKKPAYLSYADNPEQAAATVQRMLDSPYSGFSIQKDGYHFQYKAPTKHGKTEIVMPLDRMESYLQHSGKYPDPHMQMAFEQHQINELEKDTTAQGYGKARAAHEKCANKHKLLNEAAQKIFEKEDKSMHENAARAKHFHELEREAKKAGNLKAPTP